MSRSMYRNMTIPFNWVSVFFFFFFFYKGNGFKRKQTIAERAPPQKKQEIAQLTLYRTLVEDSNLINVIKVLSVIKFDPKCNKRLNSSRITIGRNLDRVA